VPDPNEIKDSVRGVFDRAAASYDQTGVEFYRPVGRTLVELADPRPGERVLDLGCGLGASAIPAAERVGPTGHVLAVDLAPLMVEGMLERAVGLSQLHGQVGDAESPGELPGVEKGEWDVVQASLVLFFLPGLAKAVRGYRELLRRPGGRLAFSWFGADDNRWDPVFPALVQELPAERLGPKRPGEDGPFSGAEAMSSFLADAGYSDVRTHFAELTVRYPDEETWWATLWSHGRRATMEALRDAGVLESTMRRMSAVLDPLRQPDGSLEAIPTMAYTIARV
jgi:ubiquinone/menaquinone biosynthesis C-methylase UbiE